MTNPLHKVGGAAARVGGAAGSPTCVLPAYTCCLSCTVQRTEPGGTSRSQREPKRMSPKRAPLTADSPPEM